MWVMGLSLLMMLFMQGLLPFGVSAVWTENGIGNSFVLVRPDPTVSSGRTVVQNAEVTGKVQTYTVQGTVRRDGSLHYKVAAYATPDEVTTIPAQELHRVALLSVPLLGAWVRVLNTTIGVLALIGLPFFMLSINVLLIVARVVLPVLAVIERRAQIKRERKIALRARKEEERLAREEFIQPMQEERVEQTPQHADDTFVTVLQPYNMQKRYGV